MYCVELISPTLLVEQQDSPPTVAPLPQNGRQQLKKQPVENSETKVKLTLLVEQQDALKWLITTQKQSIPYNSNETKVKLTLLVVQQGLSSTDPKWPPTTKMQQHETDLAD